MDKKNKGLEPMYKQLEKVIKEKIITNEFAPGTKLPTESAIASQYGVSNTTIRKAIGLLEQQEVLKRLEGKGVIVNPVVPDNNILDLAGVITEKESGRRVIVEQYIREAGPYYNNIFGDSNLSSIFYTRLVNKKEKTIISAEDILLPANLYLDFENTDLKEISILDYIHSKNYPITKLDQTIEVMGVDSKLSKLLNIEKDDVVLSFSTNVISDEGRVIAIINKYIPSGKNSFKVNFFM